MQNNSDNDNELRDMAKEMTREELLDVAKEMERQASILRRLACGESSYPQSWIASHARWTLSLGSDSDPAAN